MVIHYEFTGAMAGAAGAAALKVCGFGIGKKGAAALTGIGAAGGVYYGVTK